MRCVPQKAEPATLGRAYVGWCWWMVKQSPFVRGLNQLDKR